MQKKVFAYLEKWNMVSPGMRILTGFSGGADSAALLQILWEYGRGHGIQVRALHVNHGIRGAEADRDQAFCEHFCQERKIPLRIVREDVGAYARRERISMEEAGRKVRYDAFEQELSQGLADRVALAHHQNDQAETMLFHLMRGTGLRGLRGMEPVRMPYIRPFLCVTRREIEDWLIRKGISWVEDGTNQELDYTRNRIRHQVLAPMEQIRPGTAVHMSEAAERLLEMEDYLEQELDKIWESDVRKQGEVYGISLEAFERIHPVMQKLTVLRCLERLGGGRSPEAVHAEQILRLAKGRRGSRITLPGGCCAVLGYDEILLKQGYGIKRTEEPVYCVPGREYLYMGEIFRFTLENRDKNKEIPVNRYTKWFDYDKIKNSVILRTRQPGDYLELAGGTHKKLKDYLIDCKVPREERDACILLADGSHIIWVAGMRISEGYKVTEETRRILKVQKIEVGGTEDGETSY
ncbi:MAG: tRNA lysidine(34) synthetase TilS [Clostridiales bacterium]|nr:tRNA lysidine(34) synthetase TilS [Clostridiales bacterium]